MRGTTALICFSLMSLPASAADVVAVCTSGCPATSTSSADFIFVGDLFYKGINLGVHACASTSGNCLTSVSGWHTVSVSNGDRIKVYGSYGDDFIMFVNSTDGNQTINSLYTVHPITSVSMYTTLISGDLDNDEIIGSDHDDTIYGDLGNDNLSGRGGNDWIQGSPYGCSKYEDDICFGDAGGDSIECYEANGGTNPASPTDDCDYGISHANCETYTLTCGP